MSVDAFALEWQSWVALAEAMACKTWIIYGRASYRVCWSRASSLWKNMFAFIRPSYLTLRHLLAGALSEVSIFLSLLSVDWRKPALKGRGTLFASISALTYSSSQLRQLLKLKRFIEVVSKDPKHCCLCPGRDWLARVPGETNQRALATLMVEGLGVRW